MLLSLGSSEDFFGSQGRDGLKKLGGWQAFSGRHLLAAGTLGCRGPGLKLNSCNKLHTRQSVPLSQVAQTINPVTILGVAQVGFV